MINLSRSLMYLNQPCREAVQWTIERLSQGGLQVLQTFDFIGARGTDTAGTECSCNCSHHGTDRCDWQIVVLLVYGKGSQPVSLMVHGFDGKSWLSLVESFQANDPALETQIRKIPMHSSAGSENSDE